jgi:hypothetical protein
MITKGSKTNLRASFNSKIFFPDVMSAKLCKKARECWEREWEWRKKGNGKVGGEKRGKVASLLFGGMNAPVLG